MQESLRELENQCKERVDLLEALRQSRKDAQMDEKKVGSGKDEPSRRQQDKTRSNGGPPSSGLIPGFIGDGTIPAVDYPDLSKPPALPKRPIPPTNKSYESLLQREPHSPNLTALPSLPPPTKVTSRSPSPDHRKTMLRTLRKDGKKRLSGSPRVQERRRSERPAASKAAGLAWDSQTQPRANPPPSTQEGDGGSQTIFDASLLLPQNPPGRRSSEEPRRRGAFGPNPSDYTIAASWRESQIGNAKAPASNELWKRSTVDADTQEERNGSVESIDSLKMQMPPPAPAHASALSPSTEQIVRQLTSSALEDRSMSQTNQRPLSQLSKPPEISYRREYPIGHAKQVSLPYVPLRSSNNAIARNSAAVGLSRRPVVTPSTPYTESKKKITQDLSNSSGSGDDVPASTTVTRGIHEEPMKRPSKHNRPARPKRKDSSAPPTPSTDASSSEDPQNGDLSEWDKRVETVMKTLPKGVDEHAARNILNDIVVQGDEVHWDDVAGLEIAKKALKEAVVYPFLRPDLFMGLREPARGMLLFGPPGTGKTMLAKAVATESKSTFFAISASSLTSKWHGESEKLVKALFSLAKALAPSIIFVDEIDSLLSTRSSSSEHEASRRSKTEFLIQWSDLQRAAAGSARDSDKIAGVGDASRVLVLAATNVPWDIDDAARRRFVRRQYIPLPEDSTREKQLRTLLANQRHELSTEDVEVLVKVTDGTFSSSFIVHRLFQYFLSAIVTGLMCSRLHLGFSGSDITALAKDAAMGPLRNLGEALLYTPMDQIRPIQFADFEASLEMIRPSVSKEGLKNFEEWAGRFGERGG